MPRTAMGSRHSIVKLPRTSVVIKASVAVVVVMSVLLLLVASNSDLVRQSVGQPRVVYTESKFFVPTHTTPPAPTPPAQVPGRPPAAAYRPPVQRGPYERFDRMDTLPPRKGETYIPFADFLECLAARLHLDVAGRRELPFPVADPASPFVVPFLVQPTSTELGDMKQSICSLAVSVRHLAFSTSTSVPEVRLHLEALEQIFGGWTARLSVWYSPDVIGVPASINAGLRHALAAYTHREVPLILVCRPEVRVPHKTMTSVGRAAAALVADDLARIAELEEEVAAEQAAWVAAGALGPPLHTPVEGVPVAGGDGLLSTSLLLPQRMRLLPMFVAMEQFSRHFGLFLLGAQAAPGSHSCFFVSRLAVLVGGFLDENYLPDFYDDVDLRWRYRDLGFTVYEPPMGAAPMTVYDDIFALYAADNMHADRKAGPPPTQSPLAAAYEEQVRESFGDGYSHAYASWKWSGDSPEYFQADMSPLPPYSEANHRAPPDARPMPADAWVLDKGRQRAIRHRLVSLTAQVQIQTRYDRSLIARAGFTVEPTPSTTAARQP